MAVLEAAALGVPCVVSRFTSMDHSVERHDAGWVLDKNTVEDLVEIMQYSYDHPLVRKQKGSCAKRMIKEEYDWKKVSLSLLHYYRISA